MFNQDWYSFEERLLPLSLGSLNLFLGLASIMEPPPGISCTILSSFKWEMSSIDEQHMASSNCLTQGPLHISNFQNKCFREAPYCAIACSAPSSCWGWRALGWTWCGTFAPLLLTVGREEEENGQKWNNDKCEGNLTRGRCTKCAIVLNFFFGLPNMITLEYLQEQLEKTDEDSN